MPALLCAALLFTGGASAAADPLTDEGPVVSDDRFVNDVSVRLAAHDDSIELKPDVPAVCPTARDAREKRADIKSASFVPCGYRLVFEDDFTGLSIAANRGDQGRWSSTFTRWGTRTLATNGDQSVKVADGTKLPSGRTVGEALRSFGDWGQDYPFLTKASDDTLKLRAYPLPDSLRREFWEAPYVASMISADQAPRLRHGYWEFKARINAIGNGQHIAFWLLPDDGSWPPEVDILEVVGTHRRQFTANVHATGETCPKPMTFYAETASSNGFHIFGFEWTPSLMRWTVDGQPVREYASCIGEKPMHFLISWEIGSRWPGQPDTSTPWPAEVEIDYVRAYAPTKVPGDRLSLYGVSFRANCCDWRRVCRAGIRCLLR